MKAGFHKAYQTLRRHKYRFERQKNAPEGAPSPSDWEKDGLCAVEYYLKPYAFWDRRQDGDST